MQVDIVASFSASRLSGEIGVEYGRLRVANILRASNTIIKEHHLWLLALCPRVALLATTRVTRVRCVCARSSKDFLRGWSGGETIVDGVIGLVLHSSVVALAFLMRSLV